MGVNDFKSMKFAVYMTNMETRAVESICVLRTFEMPLIYHQALLKGYAKEADLLLNLMVGDTDFFIAEDISAFIDIISSAYQPTVDYCGDYAKSVSQKTYSFLSVLAECQHKCYLVFSRGW